jgi:hypothetical protein
VVGEKWDGWQEKSRLKRVAVEKKRGRGVYPPVGEEEACKGMKGKKIGGFPLSHDGNDGREMD